MRIVTVLRSGGEYTPEHVARLKAQCDEWAAGIPFCCLADTAVPCKRIPLRQDWPGYWSKLELFRLPGPILYLDLDSTICGSFGRLILQAKQAPFTIMRDVYTPHNMQSSVMAWSGSMWWLYAAFREDPDGLMHNPNLSHHSDQGIIQDECRKRGFVPEYWQDVLPGALVSYKKDCGDGVPVDARVVVFHGPPRPWEVE